MKQNFDFYVKYIGETFGNVLVNGKIYDGRKIDNFIYSNDPSFSSNTWWKDYAYKPQDFIYLGEFQTEEEYEDYIFKETEF